MNRLENKVKHSGVTPQCERKPRHSTVRVASADTLDERLDGGVVSARGMGGWAASSAPRVGTTRGPRPHAQRVRNLGKGVWGFGVVVGWIPVDMHPWDYCRRMGWIQIFARRTKPLMATRPYVFGDDGRYHLPTRWEVV